VSMAADRNVIAIHEAGHAVAAWALGLEITTVTVAEDGPEANYDDADNLLLRAMATAAGPIAQCLFTPRVTRGMGWGNDRAQIVGCFVSLDVACIGITRPTFRLIQRHEQHVRKLANQLLARTIMSGCEVNAFLDEIAV
jgi:hypothetical protein